MNDLDIVITSVFNLDLGKRYFKSILKANLGFYIILGISFVLFFVLGFTVNTISFVISGFTILLLVILMLLHFSSRKKTLKLLEHQEENFITIVNFTTDLFMVKTNLKENLSKNYKYDEIVKATFYYNCLTIYLKDDSYIIDTSNIDINPLIEKLKAKKVRINKIF